MAAMAGPPSNNLNVGFAHFGSAREVYDHLRQISLPGGEFVVRNFVCVIEVGPHPLPPRAASRTPVCHLVFQLSTFSLLPCPASYFLAAFPFSLLSAHATLFLPKFVSLFVGQIVPSFSCPPSCILSSHSSRVVLASPWVSDSLGLLRI